MSVGKLFTFFLICVTSVFGQIYLNESFESSSAIPSGWTQKITGDPSSPGRGYPTFLVYSGDHSEYHNEKDVATECNDWLISSAVDLSSATDPVLVYFDYVNGTADKHNVYYSTDYTSGDVPSTATWTSINTTIGGAGWTEWGPFSLPKSSNVHVAFQYVGDNAAEWWIDDVIIRENHYHYGGGDASTMFGGYYWANSTSGASSAPSQPTYNWIDPSSHTEITSWTSGGDDDGYFQVPDIGFDFTFYGKL